MVNPLAIINMQIEFVNLFSLHLGYEKVVELLIQNGANVNAVNKFNISILHYAAKGGNLAIQYSR